MKAKILRNGFIALAILASSAMIVLFVSLKAMVFSGLVSNANAAVILSAAICFLKTVGAYSAPIFLLSLVLSITQGGGSEEI